jgi:hypothetical protein
MLTRSPIVFTVKALSTFGLASLVTLAACSNSASTGSKPDLVDNDASAGPVDGASGSTGDASGGDSANPGTVDGMTSIDAAAPGPQIPIVSGSSGDAPYQLGTNTFGISGSAFFAKAPFGS